MTRVVGHVSCRCRGCRAAVELRHDILSSRRSRPPTSRLDSRRSARRLATVPVTRFDSLRLFATSSLDIALRSPSSSTPIIVVALALPELPSGACSPSSRASAGPLLGHRVVRARRHSRIAQIEYQGHNLATKGIPEFMTANLLLMDAVI